MQRYFTTPAALLQRCCKRALDSLVVVAKGAHLHSLPPLDVGLALLYLLYWYKKSAPVHSLTPLDLGLALLLKARP